EWQAAEAAYCRKAYWRVSNIGSVKMALSKERLIHWGFYDLTSAYQSVHVKC
ncbi:MAG: group II intron reverse transcriptase/maturase, partial [Lachnospiraceae bacterium]|nr:group II intron reverse transcriptase/maturase [Lachnospiraceae bacterium]